MTNCHSETVASFSSAGSSHWLYQHPPLQVGAEYLPHLHQQAVQELGRGLPLGGIQSVRGEERGHVVDVDATASQVVEGVRVEVDERAGDQAEFGDVVQYAVVVSGDAHRPQVRVRTVPEPVGAHSAARSVRPLVQDDVEAAALKLVRADEARDASADHGDPPGEAGLRFQQVVREREALVNHLHPLYSARRQLPAHPPTSTPREAPGNPSGPARPVQPLRQLGGLRVNPAMIRWSMSMVMSRRPARRAG